MERKVCRFVGKECAAQSGGIPTYCASTIIIHHHRLLLPMKNTTKLIALGAAFGLATALSQAAPAAENWENQCAKCHGADGKGQTKVGKKLNLKDYTDAKVQAAMKDEDMIKATTDGVSEGGKEKMKSFKGELSAAEIKDLVAYIRKFKA
jgi:cytochrome c6